MKLRRVFILLAAASLIVDKAIAGTLTCSGTVLKVSYHSPDTFMLQLSSMNTPVFFCHPNATFTVTGTGYTTSAETCRTMIAMLIAARETGRTIQSMYFDGDDVPATCDSWGGWKSANVRFFGY